MNAQTFGDLPAPEPTGVTAPTYTRCKFCGNRWLGLPRGWSVHYGAGDPLPGKDLKCPECGLAGASIVLDFDPQGQLL